MWLVVGGGGAVWISPLDLLHTISIIDALFVSVFPCEEKI